MNILVSSDYMLHPRRHRSKLLGLKISPELKWDTKFMQDIAHHTQINPWDFYTSKPLLELDPVPRRQAQEIM